MRLRAMRLRPFRVVLVAVAAVFLSVGPALAHPLGNFTFNHYLGIRVSPERISVDVVVDLAEIPTFQERLDLDTDGDGDVSDDEAAAARLPRCAAFASALRLSVAGAPARLSLVAAGLSFPHGAGGLPTLRLVCEYVAPITIPASPAAAGSAAVTVVVHDGADEGRLGWREIVVEGDRTTIGGATDGVLARSISNRLTAYPADRLKTPLDVRDGSFTVRAGGPALPALVVTDAEPLPGGGSVAPPGSPGASAPASSVPPASAPASASAPGPAAVPGGVAADVPDVLRATDLTPAVAVLSLVVAAALGAGHAVTPGHGKSLIAAYLVGSRGRVLDALWLGLSVSVSHTLGILALAALIVGAERTLPPDTVVRAAPAAAGIATLAIGVWMLASAIRRRAGTGDQAAHDLDPRDHRHDATPELGRRGLAALGLAGGLVPSTNALLILLVSIAAGRPAFGFVLVVAFGLGMAAVMAVVGLVTVRARDTISALAAGRQSAALVRQAPLVGAVVVLGLGAWLTAQAIAGSIVL